MVSSDNDLNIVKPQLEEECGETKSCDDVVEEKASESEPHFQSLGQVSLYLVLKMNFTAV